MRLRTGRLRLLVVTVALAIVLGCVAAWAGAASVPHAGQRVDMRMLLLANDAGDANIAAWQDNLKREGVPFDLITGATTLTATTFADGDRAKYQGVIVSGPDGTAGGVPAQFSAAEFELLWAFERKFGIRQLDVNAYPGPPLGLNFPGSTGTLDGQTATLTAAGLAQFPSLKGPVPFEDLSPSVSESFGASATPCDGVAVATCNATSFETILQSPSGASLVGVAQTKDGREEMVSTFTGNQFQLHNGLLRHGMLSWVTRGIHLGLDRSYLSVDVDDVFLPDDKWNPTTNTTPEDTAPGQQDLRMTAGDVTRLVQWQNANNVKLNMLFNGAGVADAQDANGGVDALFNAFMTNKAQFPWVNHTFEHLNLNPTTITGAQIQAQISQNNQFAQTNTLPGYNRAELVTGEHSGIGTSNPVTAPNPNMAAALTAQGVTTIGADNSRETGQRQLGSALTLPRYPMNVFYNVSTWADQLDEYDWLYLASTAAPAGRGNCTNSATMTCFTAPVTQAQFIDREASAVVRHMLGNDPRPHYAHQTNLMSDSTNPNIANKGDGILYAVIGEAVTRYRAYFKTPFQQPGQTALTQELRRQTAWTATVAANQVTGFIQDGKVNIVSTVARDVPITGTTTGALYGGQLSGWTAMTAGQTLTLDPSDPRNTAAPAITGTASTGSTLTTSNGTWTGTPTIAFAQQWQRRANASAPWTDIPSATGTTYTVVTGDAGQGLRAVITAGNRISSWSLAATAPVTVSGGTPPPPPPAAPANTALPAISGTPRTSQTLTSSTGTWTGTAPIAFAYLWQRSTNGATWSTISGATTRTYRIANGDRGFRIRVRVTASNSAGTGQAFSGQVGPVTSGGVLGGLLGGVLGGLF
jgi:hypothetical protein